MALFHLSVTQTKRSAGQSAIASAAYRAGARLYSEYYGEYSDYTRKGGVICSDILLPPHAPPEYADRQTLWNAVEKAERGKNAQLAYSFDIALQNEFSLEENIALARQFLLENFVSRGMVVDFAVHQPDREDGGIPGEIAVIRLVPARKDWNDVLRQQGDIPSRKFIAETITLRELPTAQPVPMLRMADVELTSVEWLWFPYIPFGKLTIIQGNPGEGKTYFAMRLAAACTNRKPLPGMETLEPFNIIYQTAEDGLGDTVKPRLIEADADLERVLVIDDRDTPLTLADERIARAIRENSARLVIIDPVQAFLGADVDMNRANEVRPIFRSLGDIAQATGCAIVLIGHLNKAAGTQSTYRGLGSIDITAAVRSLLFIGKLKDSPTMRVLIHEKSSLAPPGQSLAFSLGDEKGFEWIGAYDITADELLAGTDSGKTESKTAQAQMLILELLADGKRMPSAELEKAVNERGISSRTMRTAKSRIGDRLVTEKDGTAWVCYLRD